jgi:hypothetical protein
MTYCFVENNIIVNISVFEDSSTAKRMGALPSYDGANIGQEYKYPSPSPIELREKAYSTDHIISWNETLITVDQANDLFAKYFAEGSTKADELRMLIASAKTEIRERYHDVE